MLTAMVLMKDERALLSRRSMYVLHTTHVQTAKAATNRQQRSQTSRSVAHRERQPPSLAFLPPSVAVPHEHECECDGGRDQRQNHQCNARDIHGGDKVGG